VHDFITLGMSYFTRSRNRWHIAYGRAQHGTDVVSCVVSICVVIAEAQMPVGSDLRLTLLYYIRVLAKKCMVHIPRQNFLLRPLITELQSVNRACMFYKPLGSESSKHRLQYSTEA